MLAMTPEVESALRWFRATHELQVDGMAGVARWRRTELPRAGGLGRQPARLLAMLEYLRDVHNALMKTRSDA